MNVIRIKVRIWPAIVRRWGRLWDARPYDSQGYTLHMGMAMDTDMDIDMWIWMKGKDGCEPVTLFVMQD